MIAVFGLKYRPTGNWSRILDKDYFSSIFVLGDAHLRHIKTEKFLYRIPKNNFKNLSSDILTSQLQQKLFFHLAKFYLYLKINARNNKIIVLEQRHYIITLPSGSINEPTTRDSIVLQCEPHSKQRRLRWTCTVPNWSVMEIKFRPGNVAVLFTPQ